MTARFLCLVAVFASFGIASAQNPIAIETRSATTAMTLDCPQPSRIWASTDYLLWWTKRVPVNVPLVTTGDPVNDPFPGAVGQPGTRILLGADQRFSASSGIRLTFGAWIDPEMTLGLESTSFLLETKKSTYLARSDTAGNPSIYLPAFNTVAGEERAFAVADPVFGLTGSTRVESILQLWGTEVNSIINLVRNPQGIELSLLGGFRYVDLRERLRIRSESTDLVLQNFATMEDSFGTRNQFYGANFAARAFWQGEKLSLAVTGKLGLGVTHQVVNIRGNSSQVELPGGVAPTPGTFEGGFFTQSSNIGRRTSNDFGVVPEVELNLGYKLTERLVIKLGYNFMYWSQVVRPGDQVDRNINTTQVPLLGQGPATGPLLPGPLFNRTDFWVQGVSFGLEYRF